MTEDKEFELKGEELLRKTKKKRENSRVYKILRYTGSFLLVIFASLLISGGILVWQWLKETPKFDKKELLDPVPSTLIDRNGEVYTTLGVEVRDYALHENIPDLLEKILVATEDKRFYAHNGIDIIRLLSVAISNPFKENIQGASTITQQIIKLSFLSSDQTYKRKAQEIYLASKLEKGLSKEQILEIYFNKVNMGNGIYGIGTAARVYFGKTLDELTLPEIAYLVGLPKNPSGYDLYEFSEKADARKNIVLSSLYKEGVITKEEYEEAKTVNIASLALPKEETQLDKRRTNAFVDEVIKEMIREGYGDLFSGGYTIYTTIDPSKQDYVEYLLESNDIINYPDEDIQSGLVMLETKTSQVLAIGGWRNSKVERGFNYATGLTKRQPGSTLKPLLVYGPAVEYKYNSSYWLIKDEPHKYSDGVSIQNATKTFMGKVSMRTALKRSLNIPAVKTIQDIGLEKSHKFAKNLGIELDDPPVETAALGGGKKSPSPYKLAAAYAAFGNEGAYTKPHTVTKVQERNGVLKVLAPADKDVMKKSTAYIITDVLKDVPLTGTGKDGYVAGLPMAAKTGTTNYEEDVKKELGLANSDVPDAWYVGYTTNFTIAVWTGYEQYTRSLNKESQRIPALTFKALMSFSSQDIETADFEMPSTIARVPIVNGTFPAVPASDSTNSSDIVNELFPAKNKDQGTSNNTTDEASEQTLKSEGSSKTRIDGTTGLPISEDEDRPNANNGTFNQGAPPSITFISAKYLATEKAINIAWQSRLDASASYSIRVINLDNNTTVWEGKVSGSSVNVKAATGFKYRIFIQVVGEETEKSLDINL